MNVNKAESVAALAEEQVDAGLEDLRARLDGIDEKLLSALKDRLNCCRKIAYYKRKNVIPMMQSHRILSVHHHAARYAVDHDMSESFLHKLYDYIIAESCRIEDLIIKGQQQ